MGHDVELASNGAEAVERLNTNDKIAFVLSDLDMPVMTGGELQTAMLEHPVWKNIPVAIITGGPGDNLPEGVLALRKPFAPAQLNCAVIAHVGGTCPRKRAWSDAPDETVVRHHLPLAAGTRPEFCPDHCDHCPKLFYT
jgi:CheY-like chemotaxis protein